MVIDFNRDLVVQPKSVSVIQPQTSGKAKSANKVNLKGLKKKLDVSKGLWVELFHEILWSYRTTPHSTTKENPFAMVYGEDIMLPMEIDPPLWQLSQFDQEVNKEGLEYVANLIDELREVAHVGEFFTKNIATRRYNFNVKPRETREGYVVLNKVGFPSQ